MTRVWRRHGPTPTATINAKSGHCTLDEEYFSLGGKYNLSKLPPVQMSERIVTFSLLCVASGCTTAFDFFNENFFLGWRCILV